MFQLKRTVCSSMTDRHGRLKLFSAVQLMQDCSEFWKTSQPGFKKCLEENGAAQLLVYRQLEILRVPSLYEELTCTTWVFDCKGSNGFRNTIICDAAGRPCYVSWSQGAFVNMTSGRLFRIPLDVMAQLRFAPRYEMDYQPRKIALPCVPEVTLPGISVQRNDIDYNQHVNNAQYIRMALEFLPGGFEIAGMRVEYRRAVRLGARLQAAMQEDGKRLWVILRENGETCCVIEFTRALQENNAGWFAW